MEVGFSWSAAGIVAAGIGLATDVSSEGIENSAAVFGAGFVESDIDGVAIECKNMGSLPGGTRY
jgi:hypothetical protein